MDLPLNQLQSTELAPIADAFNVANARLREDVKFLLLGAGVAPETWSGAIRWNDDGTATLVLKDEDEQS